MRLGAILPLSGPGGDALTGAALVSGARLIEDAGFDNAWCFDAIGRGFIIPDPLVAVSVAATATRHVEVGTCILQLPLRLGEPTAPLDDAVPFHLRCGAAAASDRLRRLADLGFDDAILVPSSWSATNLTALRALSPS